MSNVRLIRATQSAYNSLNRKDSDAFYICTDTHNIYYGITLIFQEDEFKIVIINKVTILIYAYGIGGTMTISLTDYETTDEVLEAIRQIIAFAYKLMGSISVAEITSALLIPENIGNVYIVRDFFEIGNGPGQVSSSLFVDSVAENSRYSINTEIVVINVGTEENPICKFNILSGGVIDPGGQQIEASNTTPLMDGVASVGTELSYARGNHRHPSDTSRAPIVSPGFSGVPTAPTAQDNTNTTQLATTEFVQNVTSNNYYIDGNTINMRGESLVIPEELEWEEF